MDTDVALSNKYFKADFIKMFNQRIVKTNVRKYQYRNKVYKDETMKI